MVALTLRRPLIISGRRSGVRRRRLGVVIRVFLSVLLIATVILPLAPVSWLTAPAHAAAATAAPDRTCSPPAFGLWRLWRWRDGVARTISAAAPCSLVVSNTRARPGPGVLTIDVAMADVAAGASVTAELVLTDASGSERTSIVPLRAQAGRAVGAVVVPDFGGGTVRAAVSGHLSGAGTARCTIGVSFAPAPRSTPAPAPAPPLTAPPVAGTAGDPSAPAAASPVKGEGAPRIDVVRVTRLTSDRQAERTYHALWRWSFGDGTESTDTDPTKTTVAQSHQYQRPGTYQVRAQSISNGGELLRELNWTANVPPVPGQSGALPAPLEFVAETIVEPTVGITLTGPHKWVTGRPAPFKVTVRVSDVPRCERVAVLIDPGREFDVVWERAGRYTVRVAAVVHLRYTFPERVITVVNTYVRTQAVEVFATVVSD